MAGAPAGFKRAVVMRFLFLLGTSPVRRFLRFFQEDRVDVRDLAERASVYVLGGVLPAVGRYGITSGLVALIALTSFLPLQRIHTRSHEH